MNRARAGHWRVAPFRALRYVASRVNGLSGVLAPPYDVIDQAMAAELKRRSARNIVRMTLPEGSGDERYSAAARLLKTWVADGTLAEDTAPAVFVHRHHFEARGEPRARTGVWALLRLSDFEDGIVLPHERTMSGPKADRLALMEACGAHFSPIFVIGTDSDGDIGASLNEIVDAEPDQRAEFPAKERHEVWCVADDGRLRELCGLMNTSTFLIADGHHRYETALAYRRVLIARGAQKDGRGSHHYVLSYIVPEGDHGLSLEPTHRVLDEGAAIDWPEAAARLEENFDIERLGSAQLQQVGSLLEKERGRAAFVVVVPGDEGGWLLRSRGDRTEIPSVALHEHFLPMVGSAGVEREGVISFTRDADEAIRAVRSGSASSAALLAPSSVSQIHAAAARGERTPPKTTYFRPKVPTGIAIHCVDPGVEIG